MCPSKMYIKIVCLEFKWLNLKNCVAFCQSVSCSASLSLHFWHFIIATKKIKLDFNISTAKWIIWFKTLLEKTLQTTESTTNSWEFFCFKAVPNFYIEWIQVYKETGLRRVIYQHPNTINTFQTQIYCFKWS